MSDVYDDDLVLWSERQAALLRDHAAKARTTDPIDWPNIIEEIEAVGQSQVDQVESWLFQMILYLLKAAAWPDHTAVAHWKAEARGFRTQAVRKYRASMAQKIDLPGIYSDSLQAVPERMDGVPPLALPETAPCTLADVLADGWAGF